MTSAFGVSLSIEGALNPAAVSVAFSGARTTSVLTALCAQPVCYWRLDLESQTLVVAAK